MKNNKGVTLIELIIAMSIFSMVLAAAYMLPLTGLRLYSSNTSEIADQQDLRLVLMNISRDVRGMGDGEVLASTASTLSIGDIVYTFSSTQHTITRKVGTTTSTIATNISTFSYTISATSLNITISGIASPSNTMTSKISLRTDI